MTVELQRIAAVAASGPFSARRTVHGFVLDTLRRAILEGELTGGSRLVQAEIAEILDVSTTPVREALRDLAAEGLVRLDPHRGGVVRELSRDELEEIYKLRVLLEPEAIRRAWPHVTSETVEQAWAIQRQLQTAASTADWIALNTDFHNVLLRLAPAPRLLAILESLTAPWLMYVSMFLQSDPENRKRAAHGHIEIIQAMENNDLDLAIQASIGHLTFTHDTLAESLSGV